MSDNKPSKEQIDKWKSRVDDPTTDDKSKERFRNLLKKWDKAVEEVEEAVGLKKERKPRATKPKAERKPRATKQTGEDVEKAKAEIKKRTGKTEEECEKIIEEYRALRTKAQERKHQEEKATQDNKKRVEKLEKKGDIIEGTTEKTADAVIETAKVDVVEKIEKEIEKVEEKAEKEAKKEVEKEMPKKSATEKKEAIEKKVEKKVQEKTKVVVKRVVVDTSALLTSIADTLGKFDKDSQKEFLIKLRSDIDKLLSKYAFGGLTNGATQQMNITQSNLSSSSVNAIPFARGGGVEKPEWIASYQKGNEVRVIMVKANSREEAIREAEMSRGYHKLNYPFELVDIYINPNKMAQGGMTEHGLREGDKIIGESRFKDEIIVTDSRKHAHIVNLNEGKRYDRGGGVEVDKFAEILLDYGFEEKSRIYPNVRVFRNRTHKYDATINTKYKEVFVGNPKNDSSVFDETLDFKGNSTQGLINYLNKNGFKKGIKYAKGGGVRNVGGREYPFGSAWALEHNKVNKGEKHEVPSSQRRKKYVRGGGMSDAIKNRRGY
jgi:chemotaxis protein histidine kinase CheA